MSMNIVTGQDVYYTPEYKTLIRSNRAYLKSVATPMTIVQKSWLAANRNNFYRFIRYYPNNNVPMHLIWTIAFINDITTPEQSIMHLEEWLNIDVAVIEKMIIRSNTVFN